MTSRSLKSHPTTRRSTLRRLCDGGLLSLAVVCGGTAWCEAGVRDLFSKPNSLATPTHKKTPPTVSARQAAITRLAAQRKPGQLLAQADQPLDRLKQRDPEQRFRDAISEDDPFEAAPSTAAPPPRVSPPATNPDEVYQPKVLAEPAPLLPPEERIAALPDPQPSTESPLPEPVTSPTQLKRISEIQPFFDYQPASAIKGEVCWDLCPRPDGMPCKPDENGNMPECPSEFKLSDAAYSNRLFNACLYQWQAPDQWHNPLYFEDPSLERYGHAHHECIQPFVSVARFGVQLVGLPYQMTIDPVCKKMYNLGYYRPGECAPKKYYRIPWNTHAAVNTAAVWTGLFYIFP